MKIFFLILCIAAFFSCGNNRNELMTRLLNEKKVTEDSVSMASNYEAFYMNKAKGNKNDSLLMKNYVDSSSFFWGRGRSLSNHLMAINFSIDSLSKIK